MSGVSWEAVPDEHDYPAAVSYLSLLTSASLASDLVARLESSDIKYYEAKDILRASGLPLLGKDNAHVAADLKKIEKNKALSPVLLVRGDLLSGVALHIADGYHRVCASYHVEENTDIPCRIVDPESIAGRTHRPHR